LKPPRKLQLEEEIVKFIRENPQTTENKIVNHMNEIKLSSKMTTLSVIDELISKQTIDDDKIGKGFHRLSINDRSNFIKIENKLLEIEAMVNASEESYNKKKEFLKKIVMPSELAVQKKRVRGNIHRMSEDDKLKNWQIQEFELTYDDIYKDSVTMMLLHLLFEVGTKIKSESSILLFTRIVDIMRRMVLQFHRLDKWEDFFEWNMTRINRQIKKFSSKGHTNSFLNTMLLDTLLESNRNFTGYLRT
jgi:hypothetical protein